MDDSDDDDVRARAESTIRDFAQGFHLIVTIPFLDALMSQITLELVDLPILTSLCVYDPQWEHFGELQPSLKQLNLFLDYYSSARSISFEGLTIPVAPLLSQAQVKKVQSELKSALKVISQHDDWCNFSDVAAGFLDRRLLLDAYPETCRVFQLGIICPLGSASCERLFSKMKLLRTRLRCSLQDETLEELLFIDLELPWDIHTGVSSADLSIFVEKFRNANARRISKFAPFHLYSRVVDAVLSVRNTATLFGSRTFRSCESQTDPPSAKHSFCPNCGHQYTPTAVFCSLCGLMRGGGQVVALPPASTAGED